MTKSPITCSMNISEFAGQFTYQPLTHDTCAVTGYTLPAPVCLTLPEYAPDGRLVVAVGDRAFANCTNLTDVYLCGNSIYIETTAFVSPSQRNGNLTIRCSANCQDRNYRYYKSSAGYYGAQYSEWNGGGYN